MDLSTLLPEHCGVDGPIELELALLVAWCDVVEWPKIAVDFDGGAVSTRIVEGAKGGLISEAGLQEVLIAAEGKSFRVSGADGTPIEDGRLLDFLISFVTDELLEVEPRDVERPAGQQAEIRYSVRKEASERTASSYRFSGATCVTRRMVLVARTSIAT